MDWTAAKPVGLPLPAIVTSGKPPATPTTAHQLTTPVAGQPEQAQRPTSRPILPEFLAWSSSLTPTVMLV